MSTIEDEGRLTHVETLISEFLKDINQSVALFPDLGTHDQRQTWKSYPRLKNFLQDRESLPSSREERII